MPRKLATGSKKKKRNSGGTQTVEQQFVQRVTADPEGNRAERRKAEKEARKKKD
ncbi:hypothetical protein [Streptomyces sp. NBC_01803]|uniref:hypothetical protein n=1 Tax=Streptomyces sp. NBC_01803 TaxID=2975946 RepID=UPI002DDC686C|nr:hypothetical protein [Streptomyces sp. NBC_01803]WSA43385.1 hypothetical protein OIE51_03755 [Streptomyces sp. NBC_01803]